MSNVLNFEPRKRRTVSKPVGAELYQEVRDILMDAHPAPADDMAVQSKHLEELEQLSSDILLRRLKLHHRKAAAMREWNNEEEAIAAEMEAAVYLAYAHGVPEEAIYDLNDENLSSALQSAMTKAATA